MEICYAMAKSHHSLFLAKVSQSLHVLTLICGCAAQLTLFVALSG